MLRDRKRIVQRLAANARIKKQMVHEYGAFLRTLFDVGDWFVTLTFRNRYQDSGINSKVDTKVLAANPNRYRTHADSGSGDFVRVASDPRLDGWEPDSKYRHEPGPPVRDAALREIQHWLLELGWEAAGRTRQEIFDRYAEGLYGAERRNLAKSICKQCLVCLVYNDPVAHSFYYEIERVATRAIGWVIAEEFGRAGGRWHVHLLIRSVRHLRRKKWWRRAFVQFGRSRIEPIHE